MANYGTAAEAPTPPPPSQASPAAERDDVPAALAGAAASPAARRRAVAAGLAIAAACILLLSARAGRMHARVHALSPSSSSSGARGVARRGGESESDVPSVVSADGKLALHSHRGLLRAAARAGGLGCTRFRAFGRFGGAAAETVRRVFGGKGVERHWWGGHDHHHHHHHDHDGHHHQHHHGHHHHHHHHHGHEHGGGEAFASGPLGHPASPHSFNYACNMPVLEPCLRACGARRAAHAPVWPCLMECARSNCFVIGASCGQAAFDTCADRCGDKGEGEAFVDCSKTCFNGICPLKEAKKAA